MAYQINYTDTVNKGSITVEDGTISDETSLNFVGRNYTGYGQIVAESFLHLLENFANSNAPDKPVEGQLWYDTSAGVDQLKIYDGTNWVAAGGLKKASSEPSVTNSNPGELWVNTESQQLYLFTGSAWVLVGPQFSDGLLTGAQAEEIIGTDNVTYNVLSIKIEEQIAIIISAQEFIPKSAISGFRTGIKPGMNISDSPLITGFALKYWGTAEKAENLVVGSETISAANFLRGDVSSTTNFDLRIKNNEGLKIGSGGQLSASIDGEAGVIQHNTSGSNIDFRLRLGSLTPTVVRIDASGQVGINNSAPEEALDVAGNIKIAPKIGDPASGILTVNSTIQSSNTGTGSIVVKGGAGIARNLNVGGDLNMSNSGSAGAIISGNIVPDQSLTRNIGSTAFRYDQIYAQTFFGTLQGNVNGTVSGRSGSTDRLANATTIGVTGDVQPSSFEFDGLTGGTNKTLDIRIGNSFISNKDVVYEANNADELLLNKVVGETGIYRITKRNFLASIPLVPPGVIVPFGGAAAPDGWLLCDGSVVLKADYTLLFQAIDYAFKDPEVLDEEGLELGYSSVTHFALPDFRGRLPLGLDNLGGASANRVTDNAADAVGGNAGSQDATIDLSNLPEHEHDLEGDSGTQYYAVRAGSGDPVDGNAVNLTIEPGLGGTQGLASSGGIRQSQTIINEAGEVIPVLGEALNIMNPYLALNYIIYTGE